MTLATLVLFCCTIPPERAIDTEKYKQSLCGSCHDDFKSLIPENHPTVTHMESLDCLICHVSSYSAKAEKNAFSASIHRVHINSESEVDCTDCHTWVPDKSFGIAQRQGSLGSPSIEDMELIKEIANSWSNSDFLDALHAKHAVTCTGCHGQTLPASDASVENERCLSCHENYKKLAGMTASKQYPNPNPHNSHLCEINCTVCHHAHSESKSYCLGCHTNFNMQIPGGTASPVDQKNNT
ncbi:MAG: cytochrome c3 family protein [Deltaproteobacteria bacterium]|nr:cytochrome c3 family protein [Deltaproteobacteria bacterium]